MRLCPGCKSPIYVLPGGTILGHTTAVFPPGRPCHMSGKRYVTPSYPLWIYLKQTRQWERHECSTSKMRDYLRAVWQSAGNPTAVSK